MRITVSVDCDSLGISPEERMQAGCDLIVSVATEVRDTACAASLMAEHSTVPVTVPSGGWPRRQSAPVGQVTLSGSSRIVFRGDLDGREVRVRRLSPHDLVAEGRRPAYGEDEGDAAWQVLDDADAMRAYELCVRSLLGDA